MNLKDDKRAYAIMGCAMRVHRILGDGFLESTYGDALEVEFAKSGIPYVREDDLRVYYEGVPLKTHYRADFTCYDRQYIVELKAIKNLTRVEWAQVVHYMRATGTPYGLLLNFGRPQFQYDTFDKESLPKIFEDRGGLEETSWMKTPQRNGEWGIGLRIAKLSRSVSVGPLPTIGVIISA